MRGDWIRAAGVLAAVLLAPAVAGATPECSDPGVAESYACRQVIVEYDPALVDWRLFDEHGLTQIGLIPELEQAWFLTPPGTDIPALIQRLLLESARGVVDAERNGEFVPPECRQWNAAILDLSPEVQMLYRGQPALDVLGAVGSPGAGAGVLVAVLDTGVSLHHPETRGGRRAQGIDLLGGAPLADDRGDGIDGNQNGVVDEGHGHGTAVAGLILLAAPGARILPVRVLDDECQGNAFGFAKGIVEAVKLGARVLNLSFGSDDGSSVIAKAIRYAYDRKVIVLAPGGNQSERNLQFPARESKVIAVSAVDDGLVAPGWAAHSSKVALVAPGVRVLAPFRDRYAELDGTSFATAFVSAAAALAVWAEPRRDVDGIEALLEQVATTVDARNPDLRGELGAGVPNLGRLYRRGLSQRRGMGSAPLVGFTAGVSGVPAGGSPAQPPVAPGAP